VAAASTTARQTPSTSCEIFAPSLLLLLLLLHLFGSCLSALLPAG
jgi:hypothetical protein